MAERLFVDVSPQGTLVAPTAQARAALARRAGRWVLMPSSTQLLLLSQWEGPDVPGTDGTERAVMMGEVGGVGLLDLLGLFNQTRRSLRVVVSRGRVERAILLRDGDIASVASSDPRDRLGEFLVRIGKLTLPQLQAALDGAQAGGRKLGQHLVATNALSNHELWSAIQQQIMEIICDVVAWREGSYVIFNLPEGFAFPATPPLPTQALVLEAVRRADEMQLYRSKLPSFDAVVAATGKMPKEATPIEVQALQALASSPRSLRELGAILQRGEFDATKVLYNLVTRGAVRVETDGVPSAVPASFDMAISNVPLSKLTVAAPVPAPAPLPAAAAPRHGPSLQDVVTAFQAALREIDQEVARRGAAEPYRRGLHGFLADPVSAYAAVYTGVSVRMDGEIDLIRLAQNAQRAGAEAPRTAFDSLNELTFFALFQASELLPTDADEGLATRVRHILTQLQR
jgi:hypothetical protein